MKEVTIIIPAIKRPLVTKVDGAKVLVVPDPYREGPAKARNKGIRLARTKYVIFIGDDVLPCVGFVGQHLDLLTKEPNVITTISVGRTVLRSNYKRLANLIGVGDYKYFGPSYQSFNTVNLGGPRQLFLNNPFDENFPYPAFEDVELGWRIRSRFVMKYNPNAYAIHYHNYTIKKLMIRCWQLGYSLGYLLEKHPLIASDFLPTMNLLKLKGYCDYKRNHPKT